MTESTRSHVVKLTRTFKVPRDRVFKAWTSPDNIKHWWAADKNYSTPIAEVDLRVGGTYRLGMHNSDEDVTHVTVGTYREIDPPNKLVYTWRWEGAPEGDETLVTVLFNDAGDSTEVVLIHERFPNEESCKQKPKCKCRNTFFAKLPPLDFEMRKWFNELKACLSKPAMSELCLNRFVSLARRNWKEHRLL